MTKTKSPWSWIPSLYFAEGLPYVAVMMLSVVMYKRLGISNANIALYTSWLYLPWVIKPFWSPFVDIFKTKRWWILIMQVLIGAGLAGIAFMLPLPFFFKATLAFFWLMGFSSATHDIAADGFYMIALEPHDQAMYVGIRSTFYRAATVLSQGGLVMLAGLLELTTGLSPLEIKVNADPYASAYEIYADAYTPPGSQTEKACFVAFPQTVSLNTTNIPTDSAKTLLKFALEQNQIHGFLPVEETAAAKEQKASWWSSSISGPFGSWIRTRFGEKKEVQTSDMVGNIALVQIRLTQKPEPGKSRVLITSFSKGDKSISQVGLGRLEFNEHNWDKPAWLAIQLDPKLSGSSEATFRGLSGNIPFAWSITFFIMAGLFLAFFVYHRFALPKPAGDKPGSDTTPSGILKGFLHAFATFFQKKQVVAGIFFMLTYRFAEAQLLKLVSPFLLDSKEVGGLGLTTGEVGLVYGTIGIICLTIGGIIGGVVASRGGLKKWLWPMALSMLLTAATFMYLAYYQPTSIWTINFCVGLEQFGYGFGFTAYMMYLMYYATGENKTSHYAICTAFMALGMMIPGMFAGWMQEQLGYARFFEYVMVCSIIPLIATALLKIEPTFGKKQKA
ncbi:MAG: MFS transporter [Prevotellaceae bacterium]|jgi:PAT family beta-lactamase induction signal transducer AmpG|nr:MFS transporter [Prevotellaceae bacterium]